jgi:hypothetical protein
MLANRKQKNFFSTLLFMLMFGGFLNSKLVYATTDKPVQDTTRHSIINNEQIKVVGRYIKEPSNSLLVGYPGVSIHFNAQADKAELIAKSSSGNGYIDVIIDDKLSHTLHITKGENSYPIFFSKDAPNKKHQVTLINRTETWQSLNSYIAIELSKGKLHTPPQTPTRNLLLVGDSVTCGAMVSRGKQCERGIKGQDARNNYGMRLGDKLDANVHLVCFGGRGIIRSWNENPDDIQAPVYFEKPIPLKHIKQQWPHESYQPDAVIVSLGTNDFNPGVPDKSPFVDAYLSLLKRISEVHPQTKIFITEGAMLNDNGQKPNKTIAKDYMQTVKDKSDLENLFYMPATHYSGDSCDPHPTLEQHEKMAQDIEATLRQHLSW